MSTGFPEEPRARLSIYAERCNALYELEWRTTTLPKAAVLVALLPSPGNDATLQVILTLRSPRLLSHPGEVALPGGKAEPADSTPRDTALREAWEEIGLRSEHLLDERSCCTLKPIVSRYGIIVFPVLALLRVGFVPKESRDEVCKVFFAPLETFLSRKDHVTVHVQMPTHHNVDDLFVQHEFYHGGHRIWALTAHVLIHAASVVFGRTPEFGFDYSLYSQLHPSRSKI